jgi:uncharacterized protein (TIGR02145 family)/prepilin-type N-terminal cleavage/methylation domain-containing protein
MKKSGFTLLEILLVVGIIAILAGIVILAINPNKMLATTRNVQRKANLAEINKALYQYYIDNSRYPVSVTSSLTEICNTGATSSGHSISCTNKADLSFLVPAYLTAIPTDPQMTGTSTRYKVMKDQNNKVVLEAPQAELNIPIVVGFVNCGLTLTDARDGKQYSTVQIGNQCWMQQNLNVGTMTAGVNNQGVSTTSIQKYCYSDLESNCTTYGGLYQWNQAMGSSTTAGAQGICPAGWHIPTDAEYKTLEMQQGMSQAQADSTDWRGNTEGDQLKNTGQCQGRVPCGTSNFQEIPSGSRGTSGSFSVFGETVVWSSLFQSDTQAWLRRLNLGIAMVYRSTGGKTAGFSVRCLKN